MNDLYIKASAICTNLSESPDYSANTSAEQGLCSERACERKITTEEGGIL